MMQQFIPCPECKGGIPFNVQLLLQGHRFTCPACHCTVSMELSSRPVLETAMTQYDRLMRQHDTMSASISDFK